MKSVIPTIEDIIQKMRELSNPGPAEKAVLETEDLSRLVPKEIRSPNLNCDLTNDELVEAGAALADNTESQAQLEAEKKSMMAQFKARIDSASAEIQRLGTIIRGRREMRPVQCVQIYDFAAGVIRMIRMDTWTQASEVEMTLRDRQLEMVEEPEEEAQEPGDSKSVEDDAADEAEDTESETAQ